MHIAMVPVRDEFHVDISGAGSVSRVERSLASPAVFGRVGVR